MKIQSGKYTLYSDQYSYWITEQKTSEKGKVREERVAGYCTNLEKLFTDFSERVMRTSEAENLAGVLYALMNAEYAYRTLVTEWLAQATEKGTQC